MRAYWAIMLVVVAVVVGYKLADQHRKDCINEGRTSCTILPWSGHVPGSIGANRSTSSAGGGSAGGALDLPCGDRNPRRDRPRRRPQPVNDDAQRSRLAVLARGADRKAAVRRWRVSPDSADRSSQVARPRGPPAGAATGGRVRRR